MLARIVTFAFGTGPLGLIGIIVAVAMWRVFLVLLVALIALSLLVAYAQGHKVRKAKRAVEREAQRARHRAMWEYQQDERLQIATVDLREAQM